MIIAGPCAIEKDYYIDTVVEVAKAGATHLRGGLFKPRSSPYRWAGMGNEGELSEGLQLIKKAKELTGLPIVSEAMSLKQIDILYNYVDIFQVGSRNQQDSELLKEFGKQDKPVLLKRGFATTIKEFIMSADYIINFGNKNVILCERGIRTFETYTRNTFDINCVASVKQLSNLPIIADTSHGTGLRDLVIPVALASIVAGADGVMLEVHIEPDKAMTDGNQSLNLQQFKSAVDKIKLMHETVSIMDVI